LSEYLDTSVLVAAFVRHHPNHEASIVALERSTKATSYCSAHALAEVYAVLTRLPVRPIITPDQALAYLDDVRERLSIVSLDEDRYLATLRRAATSSVLGGQIYDALHLQCAREAGADAILTWNVTHFQRVAVELADRVKMPGT